MKQGSGRPLLMALAALAGLVAACSSQAAGTPTDGARPQQQRKVLTVGYGRSVQHIGPFEGGVAEFREIAHAGLLALDPVNNRPVARLADEVPSLERGTLVTLPDGRLQTRYRLRTGIKWHDGTPFSSKDFVFGWQVQQTPNWPSRSNKVAGLVDGMETPDDASLVITWKAPTRVALQTFTNTIWPMPRHLLSTLHQSGDIDALANSSYWTKDFSGVGAFKVRQWVEGSHVEFAANSDYVLGSPKIDTLIWRFITDQNTALAAVLADDLDATMGSLLDFDGARVAREHWAASGKGTVLMTPANWRWVNLMATNPLLSDLQVRRALLHALDRQALSNDMFFGQQPVCDIWVSPRRPQFAAVEAAITKYPYSVERAAQLLEEAGWRKGSDGVLANQRGERFVIDARATDGGGEVGKVQQVTVDYWKRVGVQADINNVSAQVDASPDNRNQWTGAYWASWNLVLEDLRGQWHSSQIPRPETRFAGGNRARWNNPRVDALIDEMAVALDDATWESDLVEIARLWTIELPHLPLYYINENITYARGITGIGPRSETGSDNTVTWNVHEWDRA
jgi:peptide/nickel transport system substrate-binding protein